MKKCLYISVHEVLEWSELSLFSEFEDMEWFSMGAYSYPQGHPTLKRPGIPGLKLDAELAALSRIFPTTSIPQDFIDRFDIIMVSHDPNVIVENWSKLRSKTVIWRSIGQSNSTVENMLRPMRYDGMKIVRMSPMENNIIGYMGEDTTIRFHFDPEDLKGWTGHEKRVVNFTQSLLGRRIDCHYDQIMQLINGFPALIYGSGNSNLGGLNGGELPYDLMKGVLRDNRVFVYGGTFPSPYTLSFIEALATGIPIVALGTNLAEGVQVASSDKYHYYEIPDIVTNTQSGFFSDDINELREHIHNLLEDYDLAKEISKKGRETAIEYFSKDKIKQEWKKLLGNL